MKKLTREEIQALPDYDLNLTLYWYFNRPWFAGFSLEATIAANNLLPKDFVNSLDAQFELAEKFEIPAYKVEFSDRPERFFFELLARNGEIKDSRSETKRTGAELLLEAIQELEEVK